jgi:hypothetical protein
MPPSMRRNCWRKNNHGFLLHQAQRAGNPIAQVKAPSAPQAWVTAEEKNRGLKGRDKG